MINVEPPVPGAVRITLQAPPNFTIPSYCIGGRYPCVFWNADAIRFPDDGAGVAFFTTRVSSTNFAPPLGCDFSKAQSPSDRCFFDPNSPNVRSTTFLPMSFIGDIEDYTVMIEHSIRGKITSIAIRNGLLEGQLLSHNGSVIRTITNATRMALNPRADGDIFTIKELLSAAGANLDSPSSAPGANKTAHESYRNSGIVIVIVIEYKNDGKDIDYKYIPQVIDGNEYKAIERIYNSTDGSITLKTAEFLVEFLMLWVLPEKEFYGIAKFQETDSFDEWRKNKKQLEKQRSTDPNVTNVNRIDFYDNVNTAGTSNTNNRGVNIGGYYGINSANYNDNSGNNGCYYSNYANIGGYYNPQQIHLQINPYISM
ncbi:10340_t:CDS:2 [Cetraspora pellucida]|uniref:10340_t:CDS:1 n=1 Tax=Cetraspora pellucida TaxID=1433469 RepID=A0A9N9D539_9GLOM|nr:10340_t:CDS:2 [Cetraspora pellucida]